VLFSSDKASGLISLRHYSISTAPSGIKKSLKALLAKRALPGDMGAMQDVSELVTRSGYGSVSAPRAHGGRGRAAGPQAAGRLRPQRARSFERAAPAGPLPRLGHSQARP
jgi:ribosome biogenesis protein SSF1/2